MTNVLDQVRRFWAGLSRKLRGAFIAVAAVVVAAFAAIIVQGNSPGELGYLFTNLSAEDAGAIVAKLKEQRIPYEIANEGGAIRVPRDRVYELRLSLANEGIPQGGGVGLEIFDKQSFGLSERAQEVNYQRALQGELERTIGWTSSVVGARVHLAIPEKRLFREKHESPSASVIVKLRPGRALGDADVQAIVHLVAASVPGLPPERVTVVDANGGMLSRATGAAGAGASAVLEFQHRIEREAEEAAMAMLERAVGRGRAMVQVSASIDFSQSERTEETYDRDPTAVRSEQETSERSVSQSPTPPGASGVPGARSNLPLPGGTAIAQAPDGAAGAAAGAQGASSTVERSSTVRNYEPNHVTSHTVAPPGRVTRLNVAAMVDGTYTGDGAKRAFTPRSAEEMKAFSKMVSTSVGYDAERGDNVDVQCVPFASDDVVEPAAAPAPLLPPWAAPAAIPTSALLAIGLGLLVARSRKPPPRPASVEVVPKDMALPRTVREIEAGMRGDADEALGAGAGAGAAGLAAGAASAPALGPGAPLRDPKLAVAEAVTRDAARAASVVRSWLSQQTS